MQNKIFRFNLDIKDKEFKTDFNLVQLDNTSMLVIKLFDEGNKLETTKEDRAEIAIDKNDNTFCVLPCNLYENEVNCTLDSNALASPGWTNCEIRILNEGKVLTSARFKIYIRENIVNNEKIKSTSEYKALEGLINEAKIMQESLKKGESVIEDVNKIKENLTEIKESILNKSKEIDGNLAVADEKINLIKTYISKSETAIENLTNNQNKIENLSNLLAELEKIRLTLDEINNSINKANIQKVELDKSTENAATTRSNLDGSIANAEGTNTTLKATDTEAKKTETSIKDLMSQLGKTENEVKQIIASGDLSKYVTDPKLQEALKSYATKAEVVTSVNGKKGDMMVDFFVGDDTRDQNYAPKDYLERGVRYKSYTNSQFEFKGCKVVGVSHFIAQTYCIVNTQVPWASASGGLPMQVAYGKGVMATRTAIDENTWGEWQKVSTTDTTYGLASQSSNGLMSAADKKRLDNIKEQVALTEAQYNALSSTQQNDSTKIYFIKA